MSEEQFIGEVEEGLIWFMTQVQALAHWLWVTFQTVWQGKLASF